MSPSTYYCWLAERLYRAVRLRRLLPPATQPLPVGFLIVVPTTAVVVVVGLLWLLVTTISLSDGQHFSSSGPGWGIDRLVWGLVATVVGSLGFATALICWLVWNQRAARLRHANESQAEAIAPPHWALRWSLGLVYFAVFSILTPLLLLGTLENTLGAAAWKRTRTALMAQGERLTVEAVVPGPVPDEQNFSSLPEIAALFPAPARKGKTSPSPIPDGFWNYQLPQYALSVRTLPNGKTDPTPPSLHDWAEAFRLDHRLTIATNTPVKSDESPAEKQKPVQKRTLKEQHTPTRRPKELPAYPAAPDGADDGTVIRTALSIGDAGFEGIAKALARPSARFPVNWSDGFNALLPHLAKLKGMQQWIELRTRARLALGDVEGAFADAKTAIRLADVVREEPLLISQLVRIAQQSIAARTIDFGILSHQWTEAQLKEFQTLLSQPEMLTAIANAFEGERALALSSMDAWCANPAELEKVLPDQTPDFTISPLGIRLPGAVGLIRRNQATLANYYSLLIRRTRATQERGNRNGFHQEMKAMEEDLDASLKALTGSVTPYNVITRLLAPAVSKAVAKSVRAEQRARLTATACAVERFRKQHGNYPASLNELVPAFLSEVPIDIMDHQPLRYRKNSDDTFILWSVGDNGIDDGGVSRSPKPKNDEILDWVWPY